MTSLRNPLIFVYAFVFLLLAALSAAPARAQAALLLEEPYGFFGAVNPTGHNALYFARICAETPVKLRRCQEGELGVVISRYDGIDGYDWVAIPLVPYLYAVENAAQAPARVDRATVDRLRNRYREAHLLSLGENLPAGGLLHGGWTELVGAAYERRIFAFRFETDPQQDDALIARLNSDQNHGHFELLYRNCSDFARTLLDFYYPGAFKRSIFPDAGITTPKQNVFKLERYARAHAESHLTVFEIAQVPGYRRLSRSNKSVAESLTTTVYAVPIVLVNPYLAGGLAVDYVARGRHHILPRHPLVLTAETLSLLDERSLTAPARTAQTSGSLPIESAEAAAPAPAQQNAKSAWKEMKTNHE
jgi:hypothetical protein